MAQAMHAAVLGPGPAQRLRPGLATWPKPTARLSHRRTQRTNLLRPVVSVAGASADNPDEASSAPRFSPVAQTSESKTFAEAMGVQKAAPTLVDRIKEFASIASLFAVWYGSNIYFNIYNKQVLQVFPMPVACTLIHLAVGGAIMLALWATKARPAPQFNKRTFDTVAPLAVLHAAGFLLTNRSLGAVAVSLTHTIKALEPFFTVILSWIFLAAIPKLHIIITLLPIVAGVVIASATDVSFNWNGFLSAMGSNVAFQGRNVLSKRIMVRSSLDSLEGGMADAGPKLDDQQLFGCITLGGCLLMLPCVALMEGSTLAGMASSGALSDALLEGPTLFRACMAGVCRLADVLSSFAILQRVSPVTHSVGNCVKRVAVIAVSIVFFRTPASFLNVLGTVVALGGVFAYSMAMAADKRRAMSTATRKAAVEDRGLLPAPLRKALRRRKAARIIKARAVATVKAKKLAAKGEQAPGKTEKKEKKDDDETDLEYYL